MTRRLALAAVAIVLAVPTTARATPSAKLVYVRGPGAAACPDEGQLRRAVATRIGYDPFFPTAPKTVIAQVSRAKDGYRGKVQIIGDDGLIRGERDLATRGDDCAELISAMALAVSIALDDLDDGTASPPPPPAVADSAAPSEPVDVAPSSRDAPPGPTAALPETRTASPSRVTIAASAGPTVSVGAAPAPSLGGGLEGTLRYAWFAARVDLRADLAAGGDLTGGGRVSVSSVLASGTLCVRGDVPFVCAGGAVASLATTTEGLARPNSDSALVGALVALAGVDIPLSAQVFVEPFVGAALVLTPVRVGVDGREAYRLSSVAGTAGLHLGWHFL
ncbi:MAG: hypothetical protein JWP87_2772 [Labilithrix sp.]|nr:hypothetical protein [Labilithrix sp.]